MHPKENTRQLTFVQAVHEATATALELDPRVYLIGEGVPDPKGIFGTTSGLQERFGKDRVFDMPVSENGCTGIVIGSAIKGMRPILVHQRMDFSLYAFDQIINNAAKWYSMFGGQSSVPMVVRMIIGRGWGQGNQHSQNLQTLYAHVPGLKVVAPSSAYAAKGLLLAAVRDNNPVIFVEHRWLHNTTSVVPTEAYEIPLGKARIARQGTDVTIVAWSYSLLETLRAVELLANEGISAEVIDPQTLSPMNFSTIKESVQKTGRLLVIDESWRFNGLAGEIMASMIEDEDIIFKTRPQRLTFPNFPSPSTPYLSRYYYVTLRDIFVKVGQMVGQKLNEEPVVSYLKTRTYDIPDKTFVGPF